MHHSALRPASRLRGYLFVLAALLGTGLAGPASAYSTLYVFGDSLSDTGNLYTLTGGIPLAPYDSGRFSNGPNWVDTLAANLGLASTAALQGGTNFAWGGAPTGAPFASSVPTLTQQVATYLGGTGGFADPNGLYVVFGGGNDIRQGSITGSVANIEAMITSLAAAGATTFLVPNLPNIGLTPEAQSGGPGVIAGATFLSTMFNAQLAAALPLLSSGLGVTIFELDVFGIVNSVVANPGAFGLTNASAACYTGPLGVGGPAPTCANPDEYLFWDKIHPTSAAHQILGNAASSVIPVPAAVWLFGSALGVMAWMRRRAA